MTSKGKANFRIESEIEKSREESDWKKLIELSEQLKTRSPNNVGLANFLLGEGKLESFLEDCAPIEANHARARFGLIEAKKHFSVAINEQGQQGRESLDAHLLVGKVNFAMGYYEEALEHYSRAKLQSLTEKPLSFRSLRIVAESFTIKALCMERVPTKASSKYKTAEWEEEMLQCYQLGGDLALLYLQEADKVNQQGGVSTTGAQHAETLSYVKAVGSYSPQPPVPQRQVGLILETAIQRAPLLYIKSGKLKSAVQRYRTVLSAIESSSTQSLRLVLTRRLAEVLLRGVSGIDYESPPPASDSTFRKGGKSESPWKPRKYAGPNLFVPKNENEEIILLLLISETMAVRDAVLSQSPEFKEARIRAYSNASAVYDLLTVALVRWGQVDLLTEEMTNVVMSRVLICLQSFERAMKFSSGEHMAWLQHAFCLATTGRHAQAIAVFKEAVPMLPYSVPACLVAARTCYENLNQAEEGLEWSQKALEAELTNPQGLESRCHLYVGIGYSLLASATNLRKEKDALNSAALSVFYKAQACDRNDHLCEFYLALLKANACKVSDATTHVKTALRLRPDHVPSLHLLVLLLSAQKQMSEALSLAEMILEEYPDNVNIMYVLAHLELQSQGGEVALHTTKRMLSVWKNRYEDQSPTDPLLDQAERRSETRSVFHIYTSEMSDKDSSSLHAHSLAASKVEQALSEVASTLSSFKPKPGPHRAWMLQLHIWLLLAEVYMSMNQPEPAALSIQEATTILPLSHYTMYTRGLLHEHKQEFTEARQCFENALAINPTHIKSMQHLGLIYHYLGSHRLAEKTLRDAARVDPHSHQTWYNLGTVLEALKEYDAAADCMATALETETTSPILPYSTIPLTFN